MFGAKPKVGQDSIQLHFMQPNDPIDEQEESETPSAGETRMRVMSVAGAVLAVIVAILNLRYPPRSAVNDPLLKTPSAFGYAAEVPAKSLVEPPSKLSLPKEEPAKTSDPNPKANETRGILQVSTTPAGASFAIYSGVIAVKTAPAAAPLRKGKTPGSIADLPPGHYTLFFHYAGWPDDRVEVELNAGEILPVEYTFPHGSVAIRSDPDGTEIFLGERSLGRTPLTVDLPPGKQEIVARHPGFRNQTKTVTIETDATATVAFQLRAGADSSRKPKARPSTLSKVGNSLKKIFSLDSSAPPKKKTSQEH
jgi:hypothetical protein